ncbi:hypothetical protein K3553_17645 [Leisingera aquaemixtae]|uniref:hypothetical protein n=1 Tax=Leisingera aquaemixtae TaxID=1396826 RepID=UPI0021A7879A|nr:hypothetical protein [Leisingera aquaemixtae]UWQ24744.1 hypothetical protein K3553_17645 [Leisingera aquaemixtae]
MKGWSIFSHSVSMVLRNFQAAIQIFLVPTLLVFAVVFAVVYAVFQSGIIPVGQAVNMPLGSVSTGFLLQMAAVWVVVMLISIWGVVAWHRYVLLEEVPEGWIPRLHTSNILIYFLRAVQLAIVSVISLIAVAFIGSAFAEAAGYFGVAILIVLFIAVALFLSRLLVILPAAAVGRAISLSDALESTKGAIPALFLLGVCVFLAQLVVELALSAVAGIPVFSLVLQLGFAVILSLLNVSIMTTLYGHYVEGRPV